MSVWPQVEVSYMEDGREVILRKGESGGPEGSVSCQCGTEGGDWGRHESFSWRDEPKEGWLHTWHCATCGDCGETFIPFYDAVREEKEFAQAAEKGREWLRRTLEGECGQKLATESWAGFLYFSATDPNWPALDSDEEMIAATMAAWRELLRLRGDLPR